jgi:hypothetical protein
MAVCVLVCVFCRQGVLLGALRPRCLQHSSCVVWRLVCALKCMCHLCLVREGALCVHAACTPRESWDNMFPGMCVLASAHAASAASSSAAAVCMQNSILPLIKLLAPPGCPLHVAGLLQA